MGKAFRLFPEIEVADWYVPIEPKKKVRPSTLRRAKKDAIKIARQLGYTKLFPDLEMKIDNADKIDTISIYMSKCRRAC